MRTFFLAALVVCSFTTNATNYYFSTLSGSDSRTPSQAENPSTPWKTLNKLNSFFIFLKPGDSILLKRNETFYGSIKMVKSGLQTAPIVIGAYGKGNKPVVTSLINLTDWVFKGNGIWETFDPSLDKSLNNILLDEVALQKGRYPNSDAPNRGYLIFESHTGNTPVIGNEAVTSPASIIDNDFSSNTNWAGAELVLRTRRWLLDRNKIVSNTDTSIKYIPSSPYEPYNKYGYFIQNSIKTLDKFGEWYYNPGTKRISLYFGSSQPVTYAVKASSISNLVSSYNISNVVIENLTIKGANEAGFDIERGSNVTVRDCDILFSGTDGVIVRDHTKFTIEDCIISNSNNNGIDFVYGADYALVKNNKIVNTSLMAGMGLSDEGNGLAIYSTGNNNIIENNEIRNTGYIGINYAGNDVVIKNNTLDSFCLVKDDGSGIYAHGASVAYTGRKVIGNIIMNGMGAGPGTENPMYSPVSGIYMDNNAAETEIAGNTLSNCGNYGIYIHNSFGMTIRNNTLYNNNKQLSMIQDADNVPIRNNIVANNIFFSKQPAQFLSYLKSSGDDIGLFAKFDSNYYARPLDEKVTISTQYVTETGSWVTQNLDLEGWKERYGMDQHSKITAKQIAPYVITELTGANKVVNGTFTNNILGTSGTACTIAHSTSGMLEDGYLEATPSSKKSSVSIKAGELSTGKNYILRYTVRGAEKGNMTIGAFLRQDLSPYAAITPTQYRSVSMTSQEYELLFSAANADVAATIVFKVDEQSKYFLDNIQLFEAETEITNPDDSIRMEYNGTNTVKTFNINGAYVDARGTKYSNHLVLQPHTSVILIKTNSSQNEAPTVAITNPSADQDFTAAATINISAVAGDEDGSIKKVEFYNGSSALGIDSTMPYTFTWSNVSPGNYSIMAKATDNEGLSVSSDVVSISVANSNLPPTINITTTTLSYYAPATIHLTAIASDADGVVKRIEFYNGTTLLKTEYTAPYAWDWENVGVGQFTVTAKAYDNKGLVGTSAAITISVIKPNQAPTITLISPTAQFFNAPAAIKITSQATDADGSIAKVDIYAGNTLLATEYYPPYTYNWNNVAPGNYVLTAKATDNEGVVTASDAVIVSVIKTNEAPTVAVTSPLPSSSFISPAEIALSASAADADGSVAKVDFYNGNTLLGTDNEPPYTLVWSDVAPGNYALTAKATDNDGLNTLSAAVPVVVVNPSQPPTVIITSPVADSVFLAPAIITVSASATDADGSITKVEFFKNDTLLATEYTSPYRIFWNNVMPGNYILTAKATDNSGLVTIAGSVMIFVNSSSVNESVASRAAMAPPPVSSSSTSSNIIKNTFNANDEAVGKDIHNYIFKDCKNNPEVKIGPNPAGNILSVYTKGLQKKQEFKISVLSVYGRLLKTFVASTSNDFIQVNLSSLSAGLYLLKMVSKDVLIYKQFEKQ